MRSSSDQFAKRIARLQLEPEGRVSTEEEVSGDAQRIDIWFVPAEGAARSSSGLLRQMTERPCMLEVFFEPPRVDEVRACLRKQLVWDHALAKRTRGEAGSPVRLWLISSGRPNTAIRGFGFARATSWPKGIYELSPESNVGLVVLRELPRTRDTLMLRLMGRGKVLKEATRDLLALPPDAPERRIQQPLAQFYKEAREIMANRPLTTEQSDFMEGTRESFEDLMRRIREEGFKDAAEKGRKRAAAMLELTYARRFGECPREVADTLDAAADDQLDDWIPLFATGSAEDIAAALRLATGK